ncbi:hypothetical protein LCGC14_1484400 [marine sediment metagenome]|uniref:Radical SAM core domain-containing protein n=1 Tax=marine sediment metagenome TaxID=412755 RepID=A0A0F9MAD6_9ZZZZ|nr:hypothetical protein [Desulfobacterales bacterium]
MGLNKSSGNMYGFVTHTFNTVKGKCPHDCSYCYMKRFGWQSELHIDEVELKTDLYRYGKNRFIFVGSSCDMWANGVSYMWIKNTLDHCIKYPKNKYLFQSKNPRGIFSWIGCLPKNSVIATTVETNRAYPQMALAPPIEERIRAIRQIKEQGFKTMITIEPIMDFDIMPLIACIFYAGPDWVNIGADSQGHNLPEPTPKMIKELIERLSGFTKVRQKPNLKRLLKG